MDRIISLLTLAVIMAWCLREPEAVFLVGWKPDRKGPALSFADAEQLRLLRQAAAIARSDRKSYEARHRMPTRAEYRAALAAIDPEPTQPMPAVEDDPYEALYRPWKPRWFD